MKYLLLIILFIFSLYSYSNTYDEIMDILKVVESNNNPKAIGDNGKAHGILQIHQICIDDVNKTFGTDYTHEDAFDESCSEEIFGLYMQKYGEAYKKKYKKEPSDEILIRIWNGGPKGYKRNSTLPYLKKYQKLKMNKRKCIVNGKQGIIKKVYETTCSVFIFQSKTTINVGKEFIKLLPKEKGDPNQLKLF